jgi:hypothetical protein
MLFWYSAMMLAFEAARVIETRLHLPARGSCTTDELFLMVSEKLEAMDDTKTILIRSGHPELVVENYRKIVAANAAHLLLR